MTDAGRREARLPVAAVEASDGGPRGNTRCTFTGRSPLVCMSACVCACLSVLFLLLPPLLLPLLLPLLRRRRRERTPAGTRTGP